MFVALETKGCKRTQIAVCSTVPYNCNTYSFPLERDRTSVIISVIKLSKSHVTWNGTNSLTVHLNHVLLTTQEKENINVTSVEQLFSHQITSGITRSFRLERNHTPVTEEGLTLLKTPAHSYQGEILPLWGMWKRLQASADLISQRIFHTKEKIYSCQHCGRIFTTLSALVCDERMHHVEKPHKCNYCEKGFLTSAKCLTHEHVHTQEKPRGLHSEPREARLHIISSSLLESGHNSEHRRIHTSHMLCLLPSGIHISVSVVGGWPTSSVCYYD